MLGTPVALLKEEWVRAKKLARVPPQLSLWSVVVSTGLNNKEFVGTVLEPRQGTEGNFHEQIAAERGVQSTCCAKHPTARGIQP